MDLTRLESYASAISNSSPAIKKWALEQVAVTKAQEARLVELEKRLAAVPTPPTTGGYRFDEIRAQIAGIARALKGA
jgi:hypothetical protein